MSRLKLRAPALALLLALAVVGSLAATAIAQNAGPAGRPLVLGVVDIGVVFKGYKRKDELEKQINALKERLEKQAQSERETVQKLRKDLDLHKQESPSWRQKKAEILRAMQMADVNAKLAEEELKSQIESLTLQLLDEIEETVRDYGSRNPGGYDLILKIDTKGWGDEKFQERIFRAQVSAVLYHDVKTDITQSILAVLNNPATLQRFGARTLQPGVPVQPPK